MIINFQKISNRASGFPMLPKILYQQLASNLCLHGSRPKQINAMIVGTMDPPKIPSGEILLF